MTLEIFRDFFRDKGQTLAVIFNFLEKQEDDRFLGYKFDSFALMMSQE